MKKSAIVLAGGKGSRLGYVDKAFLKYKDLYFIDLILKKLTKFDEIIVVTNSPEKYESYKLNYKNIKIVEDVIKDVGPLGGILSGLQQISYNEALILSCDTPFISEIFINYLRELDCKEEVSVPIIDRRREPLCSLYKKSVLKAIETSILEKNYKIASIFSKVSTNFIDLNSNTLLSEEIKINREKIIKSFYNINTPEELKDAWNFLI